MALRHLQVKIGVSPDGEFGPITLKKAAEYFSLSPVRAAHFFGQTGHETGGFKLFEENLNYSVEGLHSTFGKYFPGSLADAYGRRPERIANRVYANRMGNGDEKSGDGWKYRGRGAVHLTGRDNYKSFSNYISEPAIMSSPDLVSGKYCFDSAKFFFDKIKIWSVCDKGVTDDVIESVTKLVNGGLNGLDHRASLTKLYYSWLVK